MSDEMELEGGLAPPMANGDLLFEAPWQGRVFGIARVLCEQGFFSWDDFRRSLISKISVCDETHRGDDPYIYYDHFLGALSDLLSEKDLCTFSELLERDDQLRERPHNHDH